MAWLTVNMLQPIPNAVHHMQYDKGRYSRGRIQFRADVAKPLTVADGTEISILFDDSEFNLDVLL